MPSEFTIRDATEADLPAITTIYREAVESDTASFELEPPDLTEMTRRFTAARKAGFPYIVADNAERHVLGYAYAGSYRARPAYRFTVEDSIYVDANARRKGVARALLMALIERCTALDFRQMLAIIATSNNADGSVALHKACGFSDAGRLQNIGRKFGQWHDTIVMQRALGDGADAPPR